MSDLSSAENADTMRRARVHLQIDTVETSAYSMMSVVVIWVLVSRALLVGFQVVMILGADTKSRQLGRCQLVCLTRWWIVNWTSIEFLIKGP